MAAKETAGGNTAQSAFPEIGAFAQKHVQDFFQFQSRLWEQIQQVNRHWLERMQSEATLASEAAAKLTAVHSLPDLATACQECLNRRMELATEDSKYMMTEGQKMMQAGARLFSNGWSSAPKGGST